MPDNSVPEGGFRREWVKSWLMSRPIAHRGLHCAEKNIIENTASSILSAINENYAIEVDLQYSADGEAIVFHDDKVDRLTTSQGWVAEYSLMELQELELKNTSDKILSLNELLELVAGVTPIFLEVKGNWNGVGDFERRIVKSLRNYKGLVAVMSFDPDSIAAFRKISPKITRGIVAEKFSADGEWKHLSWLRRLQLRNMLHLSTTKPDFIAYDINSLPAAAVSIMRGVGIPILTWTVKDKEDLKKANKCADNIIFEGFQP